MNDEELAAAAEAAQRELDAAGLTPDELRLALVYVCGYAPDAVRASVAAIVRTRPAAAQAAEGRPPRITVRHHFTPAHAVQATQDNRG